MLRSLLPALGCGAASFVQSIVRAITAMKHRLPVTALSVHLHLPFAPPPRLAARCRVGCCFFLFVCQGDFAEDLLLDNGSAPTPGGPVGPVLGMQRGQVFSVPSPAGGAPLININLAPAPRYVQSGAQPAAGNPAAPTPSAAAYSVAFPGSSQGAGAAPAGASGSAGPVAV